MVVNNLYEADLPANVRTASYKEKFYPVSGLDAACTNSVNDYLASSSKKLFTNGLDAALIERASKLKEYLDGCKIEESKDFVVPNVTWISQFNDSFKGECCYPLNDSNKNNNCLRLQDDEKKTKNVCCHAACTVVMNSASVVLKVKEFTLPT